ncbi:interleukin-12 subunit alpha [Dunckerocampus dactyliophorus]|uniref:interleukin-12 subunit alpha n=1 Tax=Dunckerocampus dactyliophorus TaxID=161453 RepID=UPI0024055003|nr:interleukin-12 subunit alpha [Dunckerocampus dactyliophorus]
MAHFISYLMSCLLLTSTLNWRTSTSLPVRNLSAQECATCSTLFRRLLVNITGLLSSDVLCYGVASERVTMSGSADTLRACAPVMQQNSGCMVQRNSSFSEGECLMNIMRDVLHYHSVIQSYLKSALRSPEEESALLRPTLELIQNLKKNCSLISNGGEDLAEENASPRWGDNTFTNRLEMCKMMRGFYVRAITINRAMGYISSGDHRK